MSDTKEKTVCFCFGYTRGEIEADFFSHGHSTILEGILAEKRTAGCRCAELNPSGG